jgi:hypothetical protein
METEMNCEWIIGPKLLSAHQCPRRAAEKLRGTDLCEAHFKIGKERLRCGQSFEVVSQYGKYPDGESS